MKTFTTDIPLAFIPRVPPARSPSKRPRKRRKVSSAVNVRFGEDSKHSQAVVVSRGRRNLVRHTSMAMRRFRNRPVARFAAKRKRTDASAGRLALSKVRKLERKQEVKIHDIAVTTLANVSNAGLIRDLALIAQNNTTDSRDGDFIEPFLLSVRMNWAGDAAATTGVYRTIIFRDKQQEPTVTPTVLNVLQSTSPLAQYALVNRGRWKILYDRTFTGVNDAAIRQSWVQVLRLKLTLPMQFRGAATTDIQRNGLYMIVIFNNNANMPDVTFSTRLFFND